MELIGIPMVAHKEHVAYQRIQAVAQVGVGLVCLALCVIFGLHAVAAVVCRLKISVAHHCRPFAEHAVEHPVGDERFGEQFFLEVQAIGLNLLACHSECRRELAQQTVYGIVRYLPYTEEAEHMVYAVGIKEFCHV